MAQPRTPGLLILCRHGQSAGNLENRFTGWLDLMLTSKGKQDARLAGLRLKAEGLAVGQAFASALQRTRVTCSTMLESADMRDVPVAVSSALNERDYGDLTGLNKDEARGRWGEAQVRLWRRSYADAPPRGESLRDTAARVLPYYLREILPAAMAKGALVVAHGNSLRALVMALDGLMPGEVENLEIATLEIIVYRLNAFAGVASKRVLGGAPGPGA